MHVLGNRTCDDLLRGQPDALVDDLEAGVPGPDRNLLGTVRMSVEAGFADQQPQPSPELIPGTPDLLPDRARSVPASATPTAPDTPVGARNSPKTPAVRRPTLRSSRLPGQRQAWHPSGWR